MVLLAVVGSVGVVSAAATTLVVLPRVDALQVLGDQRRRSGTHGSNPPREAQGASQRLAGFGDVATGGVVREDSQHRMQLVDCL